MYLNLSKDYLFHCPAGSAYNVYMNMRYLHHLHDDGARGGAAYCHYALPMAFIEWLVGLQTGEVLCFTALLYGSFMICIAASAELVFQASLEVFAFHHQPSIAAP